LYCELRVGLSRRGCAQAEARARAKRLERGAGGGRFASRGKYAALPGDDGSEGAVQRLLQSTCPLSRNPTHAARGQRRG